MRLKQILVYLALVVLLCTLSSWAADDVEVEDEEDLDSDSESEPEDQESIKIIVLMKNRFLNVIVYLRFYRARRKRRHLKLNHTNRRLSVLKMKTPYFFPNLLQSVANFRTGKQHYFQMACVRFILCWMFAGLCCSLH